MATMVQMFNDLVTFSVLEVFKNATFVADDDGNLKMDINSLPSHLQTMSSDNIASKFTALQSAAKQNVQTAEQQQMQLNQMAQQSMMGGALSAALLNVMNPPRSVIIDMIMVQFISIILTMIAIMLFKGNELSSTTLSYFLVALFGSVLMVTGIYSRITR